MDLYKKYAAQMFVFGITVNEIMLAKHIKRIAKKFIYNSCPSTYTCVLLELAFICRNG